MSNHQDFTRRHWGHSLEMLDSGKFVTYSSPPLFPGDTFSYETADHRIVTYRVLEEGFRCYPDPGDQSIFSAVKVS